MNMVFVDGHGESVWSNHEMLSSLGNFVDIPQTLNNRV